MMLKTYQGGCHCGSVRFEADIDLQAGSGKCNCSWCAKARWWGALVKPADFRLLSDDADLADYQFGAKNGHHRFCRACGVQVLGHGYVEAIGGEYRSVSIATLDGVDPSELAAIPVRYTDGLNNNWFEEPAETRRL
jgi:hypothetical protein